MKDFLHTKNNNQGFAFFLGKLLIFIGIVFLLDLGIGRILQHYYFTINHEDSFRTNYVLKQTKAEILIFGSSRANHHYNVSLISEKMNQSCYNAGRDGNFIFYHYALLKGMLKRYKPGVIILDLCPEDLYQTPQSYDRIVTLLPYYRPYPELRNIIELKSRFEKYKLLSRIYPFNSQIVRIITGNIDIHNRRKDELTSMGYVPLTRTWKQPIADGGEVTDIDPVKLRMLKSFITECKQADIRLLIFISPFFVRENPDMKYIDCIEETASWHGVPFWNYSQDDYFLQNPEFFADPNHLNNTGADRYTSEVINKLKNSYMISGNQRK